MWEGISLISNILRDIKTSITNSMAIGHEEVVVTIKDAGVGHFRLTLLYIITEEVLQTPELCDIPLTIKHVVLEFLKFNRRPDDFFGNASTTKRALGDGDLGNIFKFFMDTAVLSKLSIPSKYSTQCTPMELRSMHNNSGLMTTGIEAID